MAEFAKSLAHPARIAIVTTLTRLGPLCCGELVARLPLAQSTVSQHLRALQTTGLIDHRDEGTRVVYSVHRQRLRSFCQAFQETLGTAQP